MDIITDILNDHSRKAYKKVFSVPIEELHKLCHHQNATVRFTVAQRIHVKDLPLLISDPDPDVRAMVAKRAKDQYRKVA